MGFEWDQDTPCTCGDDTALMQGHLGASPACARCDTAAAAGVTPRARLPNHHGTRQGRSSGGKGDGLGVGEGRGGGGREGRGSMRERARGGGTGREK